MVPGATRPSWPTMPPAVRICTVDPHAVIVTAASAAPITLFVYFATDDLLGEGLERKRTTCGRQGLRTLVPTSRTNLRSSEQRRGRDRPRGSSSSRSHD